jgi:hypothetical protein
VIIAATAAIISVLQRVSPAAVGRYTPGLVTSRHDDHECDPGACHSVRVSDRCGHTAGWVWEWHRANVWMSMKNSR